VREIRKYLRSIARHNMKKADIEKMNKTSVDNKGNKIDSKFSRLWRNYINPQQKQIKSKKAKAR
jgi:hypothetical protein